MVKSHELYNILSSGIDIRNHSFITLSFSLTAVLFFNFQVRLALSGSNKGSTSNKSNPRGMLQARQCRAIEEEYSKNQHAIMTQLTDQENQTPPPSNTQFVENIWGLAGNDWHSKIYVTLALFNILIIIVWEEGLVRALQNHYITNPALHAHRCGGAVSLVQCRMYELPFANHTWCYAGKT